MSLSPYLITPFQTGLDTDLEPWLAPPDSFSILDNLHVKHGRIEKRAGYNIFGQLTNRVMGIARVINSDNTKTIVAFDTTRAYRYNGVTNSFDVMDAAAIMSSSDTDYVWAENWQSSDIANRLYFTNGKAYDGVSVDGIRYYTGSGLATVLFTPDLNSGATRILYGGKLLFTIKQRLVVLNTYEYNTVTATTTNYPQRARWCQAQGPSNWDDITPGGGGYVDAPTGGHIISARALQDAIIVFFTDGVWTLRPVSDPALPFRWDKINDFRACDGKMASVGYDRYVTSLGVRGITATDGVETRRIDDRISDFVIDAINVDEFDKVYCARSYSDKRWWTLYANNTDTENSKALIYDDDSSSFSTYTIALNCLGYGNAGFDYGLDDFTVANNLDWTLIDGPGDSNLQDYFWQDNQELLLGGATDGYIYQLEMGGDDNGSNIDAEFLTAAWNPFKDQGVECQMSYIDFFIDTDTQTQAAIEFYKDNEISPYALQYLDFLPNLGYIARIINVTQANPANVNAPDHGLSTGDVVYIYGVQGMVELIDGPHTITVVDTNHFTLDGIDSTAFTAYTTGGQVVERRFYKTKTWKRAYAGAYGYQHRIRFTALGGNRPFRIHAFKPYFRPRGRRTVE